MTTATVHPAPRRRNADQWRTLLLRFEQGDLSPVDFCRREQLAPSSFQRWRHRFAAPTSTPTPAAGFVELLPPASSGDDAGFLTVELDLPGGGSLRIRCRR
jgi:hypothetical protein